MAHSPSHRSSASLSTNLAPPDATRQRRMTSPTLPPPSPLNLPEPVYGYRRPPSPLRNRLTIDPETGEVSDDGSAHRSEADSREGRQWGQRTHSPSPSVAKFAANIAQRVGSLMSGSVSPGPRSNGLPTDEELEAEAEMERERSMREAERIIMQETEDRRTVEERVMAMLQSTGGSPRTLPVTPTRSQTLPAVPPSPQSSQKDGSWWTLAKNKLTPTKEPLTPAQQVILETKVREKEQEKERKRESKMKQKSKEWPSVPDTKFEDPSFITLGMAAVSTPSRPASAAPSSPANHFNGIPGTPPSLAASPLRSGDPGSPSRVPPPLYAQFNAQGTLDVPGTLLTIVKRFEKLEKWTVGHVRALEERMDDVERWLVEKEKEKERNQAAGANSEETSAAVEGAMHEVREELAELQGRVGELGREMAKLLTAPGNLSSGPARNSASMARAPSASSSVAVRSFSQNITVSPTSTPQKARASASPPPVTTPAVPSRTSRTRLPYPTGDYATPPDSSLLGQGAFSPANSPPSSITSATKTRHMSISGLPNQGLSSTSVSPMGLPRTESPSMTTSPGAATSPPSTLPPPPAMPAARQTSVSPTPRKRYTVALGGPIMSASREDRERSSTTQSRTQPRELSTAFFSTSPASSIHQDDSADESDDSGANEETIGRAAARQVLSQTSSLTPGETSAPSPSPSPSVSETAQRRARPQTMYGSQFSNIAAPSPVTPVNVRLRSRSTDRFGLGISDANGAPITATSGKFVDPLVVRRQTQSLAGSISNPPKVMPGKPKVPVGELVAFFDQEKASHAQA